MVCNIQLKWIKTAVDFFLTSFTSKFRRKKPFSELCDGYYQRLVLTSGLELGRRWALGWLWRLLDVVECDPLKYTAQVQCKELVKISQNAQSWNVVSMLDCVNPSLAKPDSRLPGASLLHTCWPIASFDAWSADECDPPISLDDAATNAQLWLDNDTSGKRLHYVAVICGMPILTKLN